MSSAKERARALARESLDGIRELLTAVVAATWIPLGVFVCEDRSEQFKNFGISLVFGRNQFDAVLLTALLAAERRCDFGIVNSKVCAE